MELGATARPAVGDRPERLLSDVCQVANAHTKNVLIVYTEIGKQFSTNMPLFSLQRFQPKPRPILLLEFMSRHV